MIIPKHLSVTTKFVLTFLSVLTVSMAFMGYILYDQSSKAAISQGQILMMQNVLQVKNNVSQKANMVENLSQIIAFDPKIQNFLGNAFMGEPFQLIDYRDQIAPILDNLIRQNPYIRSIRIFMANESIPELYDGFYHLNRLRASPRYSSFLQSASSGKWQGLHPEQTWIAVPGDSRRAKVFSYDRKIFSLKFTDMAGMLEIEVDRDVLFDSLGSPQSGRFGNVFVADKNGFVVSGNVPSLENRSAAELGLPALPPDGNLSEVMRVKGVRSIVVSVPLEGPDLRIVGIFPVSPIIESMKHSQKWIAAILLTALLLSSGIVTWITHALLRRMKVLVKAMKQVREGSLDVSVPVVSSDEFTQMAVSFNLMTGRIHELVETVYKSRIMEKEAELRALESQINPHFLYNTLATISWVARKVNSPEIPLLANSLARFYRLVLNKGLSAISVRDEIEMVKVYLQIQKFRFESLFDAEFRIDDQVLSYEIPKNILQPLVENALSHGIEPKRSHGTILIEAGLAGGNLVFRVIDDGVGMTADRVQAVLNGQIGHTSGSGYAVKNMIQRLIGYYGDAYKFELFSRPGIGTVVTLTLPKE